MDTQQRNQYQAIVTHPFTVTLIKIKANQFCRRADFSRSDYNDLRQDMCVYLLEKAHLFDPARGTLQAFVISALKTWAAMRVRYRKRTKRFEGLKALSLEGTVVDERGDENVTLGEVLLEEDGQRLTRTYPISQVEHFELREAIEAAMQSLSAEDRELLAEVTENGITSTAKSRGVSWRQVKNAMVRTRQHFENFGLGAN